MKSLYLALALSIALPTLASEKGGVGQIRREMHDATRSLKKTYQQCWKNQPGCDTEAGQQFYQLYLHALAPISNKTVSPPLEGFNLKPVTKAQRTIRQTVCQQSKIVEALIERCTQERDAAEQKKRETKAYNKTLNDLLGLADTLDKIVPSKETKSGTGSDCDSMPSLHSDLEPWTDSDEEGDLADEEDNQETGRKPSPKSPNKLSPKSRHQAQKPDFVDTIEEQEERELRLAAPELDRRHQEQARQRNPWAALMDAEELEGEPEDV